MIMHEARYAAARDARIKNNRRIGSERRWLSSNPDARRVADFMYERGDYAPTETTDAEGFSRWTMHPHRKAAFGEFFGKMLDSLTEWGALTDAQTAAIVRMMDKAAERIAEREEAKEAKRETARHVGTVGERRAFDLVVKFRTSYETQYGTTKIFVMEDADANVVVYKGSTHLNRDDGEFAEKGDRVQVKATIKEHGVRDGVAQTVIARPKQS